VKTQCRIGENKVRRVGWQNSLYAMKQNKMHDYQKGVIFHALLGITVKQRSKTVWKFFLLHTLLHQFGVIAGTRLGNGKILKNEFMI